LKKTKKPEISVKDAQLLEERAERAEALAADLEAKITRLVSAVKNERGTLRDKTLAAEQRAFQAEQRIQQLEGVLRSSESGALASEVKNDYSQITKLESKLLETEEKLRISENLCRKAEERAEELEQKLAKHNTLSDSNPSFSEEGAPPPPAPPPPPSPKFIDSTKLNIKKKVGEDGLPLPVKETDPRQKNMANLIEEIKKGIKLRPRDNTPKTVPKSDVVDLGALANDISKIRQNRIKQKTTPKKEAPRRSTTLSNLLKELDDL